jgi:hypothetical protein
MTTGRTSRTGISAWQGSSLHRINADIQALGGIRTRSKCLSGRTQLGHCERSYPCHDCSQSVWNFNTVLTDAVMWLASYSAYLWPRRNGHLHTHKDYADAVGRGRRPFWKLRKSLRSLQQPSSEVSIPSPTFYFTVACRNTSLFYVVKPWALVPPGGSLKTWEWPSNLASDLYSGGARLESRPAHLLN